jgi:hypothetical protein
MTEPKPLVEYGTKCLLCREDAAASRLLCWRHCDEMRDMLDVGNRGHAEYDVPASIPVLFASLDVMPGSNGAPERRAPGFESTPPGSVHVMAMRDGRSLPDDQDRVRSVPGTLRALAELIGSDLGERATLRKTGVDVVCSWLSARLVPITRLPWADDIYRDLRELRDALRAAHGEELPKVIGHCTAVIVIPNTSLSRRCGHALYAPQRRWLDEVSEEAPSERRVDLPDIPPVHCPRCHAKYDGMDQLRLEAAKRKGAMSE